VQLREEGAQVATSSDAEEAVIIGAGQAGLAVSYELSKREIKHVVLERGRIGQTWRGRWDSFCLVLPNWTLQLPGHEYDGDDPDSFMPRDDIVRYLESYADKTTGEIREGVEVSSLEAADGGGFLIRTNSGDFRAANVVLATGAYQKPHRPPGAASLPAGLFVIDAEGYTDPDALPGGAVLVVGSGQTGCQIAEELRESGRETFLACGKAPWIPRRIGDRDGIAWLIKTGFFDMPPTALPSPTARLTGNPQASGKNGGHDLHFRTLQAMGVQLLGRFSHADGENAVFAKDLAESVAFGDARYNDSRHMLTEYGSKNGIAVPDLPDPPSFDATAPETIELSKLGAVVFTSGFRPDYTSWVKLAAFDEMGFPVHQEGASTTFPGLYFVGVHFLRKRKSSLLFGVGEDAAIVAQQIAG
jgi:putative flavoprotein involved in K+ transport